jgi:Cytochrome c7 and related cytochrome c
VKRLVVQRPWLGAFVVAVAGAALPSLASEPAKAPAAAPPAKQEQLIQAEPPPFTPGIFPCTQCHDKPGDPTRRELGFHDDVKFEHDAEHRWCLDCHDNRNRDVLHLSNGDPVPFTESYRLCGQCHGDKFRDWRVGVHGKRVGMWDGQKTYYLCVNCHNPHSPRFKPIKPEPRPQRPEEMRR